MAELPPDYERLLAAAEHERAPLALRQRIEDDRGRLARRGVLRRRLRPATALAATAIVAVAVGLSVSGGGDPPTVLEAAALGAKPAADEAPSLRRGDRGALDAAVGGVRFPSWREMRWTASGRRRDELGGRKAETVFYTGPGGARVGYTIVDEQLPWPQGSRTLTRRGVAVRLVRDGDRRIATWRIKGKTCVISAPATLSERRLAALAFSSTYA